MSNRVLRPLPASGRIHRRFAVIVDGETQGEVMQITMRGRRRMLGDCTVWVTKRAGGSPIWAQWFDSAPEAAIWMTEGYEALTAYQRENGLRVGR